MLFDLKLVFFEIDLGNAVKANEAADIVLIKFRRFTNFILTFDSDIHCKDIIILRNYKWIKITFIYSLMIEHHLCD